MRALSLGTLLGLMRSRGFRLALLAFQFLWLNVIVPGHRRGVVLLPGTGCSACESAAVPSEHPVKPVRSCCSHHPGKTPAVPSGNADHCAICFFAARLSPAVAVDFTHPPLQLVGYAAVEPICSSRSTDLLLTYLGRAPPVVV
jgi:hypothetical protein